MSKRSASLFVAALISAATAYFNWPEPQEKSVGANREGAPKAALARESLAALSGPGEPGSLARLTSASPATTVTQTATTGDTIATARAGDANPAPRPREHDGMQSTGHGEEIRAAASARVHGIDARPAVPAEIATNTRAFVEKLYRDFHGEKPDPRAVDLWANLIDAGTITPEQAVESFLDSARQLESVASLARIYLATFLRAPDYDGLSHWRDAILAGRSLEEIGAEFARGPEFASLYGGLDNAAFIEQAFNNTMGRDPTEAERMQWRAQLGPDPASRGRMMIALAESEEFRQSVRGEVDAIMLYAGLLGRGADSPGFAGWMAFLEDGNPRAALIRGFLASSEYRGRLRAPAGRSGG